MDLNESRLISEQHQRLEELNRHKKCNTYFIQERNVVFWFVICMFPFLVLAFVEMFLNTDKYIPVFSIQACCKCSNEEY